jgi:exodeoxyribonuclease VII small subunit
VTAKKKNDTPTFEESLERLEIIVARLEKGDARLEEGLALFEEGVALTRTCHEMLAGAERTVSRLVRDDDGELTLDLFADDEAP